MAMTWRAKGEGGRYDHPQLPPADAEGNRPAAESLRVLLAQKLLRRRRAAGLSQVELARRAGVRAETINRIEKGKQSPSVETVERITKALERLA
jgi:DNA-binding XRE family transcriptional regulator